MPSRAQTLTPDQVRGRLRAKGKTLTQWAREHGYPRDAVYRVLGGQYKGNFGQAHNIAVDLGLKVPDVEPSTTGEAGNTQKRHAA